MIKNSLIKDIEKNFSSINTNDFYTISDILQATNEKFIFILDEWDYIFSHNLFEEHQNDFLEFLRNLLKDKPYVALAYMTGVLPIKKYSEGSALNMFTEYSMTNPDVFERFVGFTQTEVEELLAYYGMDDRKGH